MIRVIFLVGLLFFQQGLLAEVEEKKFKKMSEEDVVRVLTEQLSLMRSMDWLILPQDRGRHNFQKKTTEAVLKSIAERQDSHVITMAEKYRMIKVYGSSTSYFDELPQDAQDEVKRVLEIVALIEESHGFKNPSYYITQSIFTQMHELFVQFVKLVPDLAWKKELEDLYPAMIRVIGKGALGDRPLAFKHAIPLCEEIRKLYPRMDEFVRRDDVFRLVTEIRGLNDSYYDFAQIEQLKQHDEENPGIEPPPIDEEDEPQP